MVLRYILANIPYTLSEVKLGSLVPNITCPNQDALVPSKQLKEGIDFSWRDQKNFSFTLDQEQSSLIRAQITRLAKLHGHSLNDQHNQLWSKEGRIYELTQPEQLFQELCKDKTIEDSILKRDAEGETLHFVVGLRTFYDATTVDEEVRDSGVMGKTNLPTGEVASGGAATGDILDMGIEGGARSGRRKVESFEIPGERIFAICYRKVKLSWLFGDDINAARLRNKNVWTVVSGMRRGGPIKEEAVETDLEDEDQFPNMKPVLMETAEYYLAP